MAAPTYATDLTDINVVDTAGGTTSWSGLGGGASGLNSETDYYIQGDGCISKNGFTADTKGMIYSAGATTITSGDAVFMWARQANRNLLDTLANGGGQVVIGSGTNAFDQFYVDGNNVDGSDLLSWVCYAVDPTQTPTTSTGSPTGTSYFGFQWVIGGSGSLKGAPNAIDAFRHGREITCVDGDVGNGYATFDGAATHDANTTRRWGLIFPVAGGYQQHGAFVMGTVATAVDFRDSNRTIAVLDDIFVPSTFNEFEIRNASSNVQWDSISISALGTTAPFVLTLDVGTFTGDSCTFVGAGATSLASTSSMTSSTWIDSGAVTAPASDLTDSSIITPTVAADTGALIYNSATSPDGNLDDMTFEMGTNSHHAIDFGTSVTSNITLRGIEFTGFGSTPDANDSTVRFLATGGSLTLSLIDCTVDGSAATTGNFSVDDAAGVTVTVSINPVTTLINIKDENGDNEAGVRVYMEASSAAGDLPFEQSISSISRSGTTATVTFAAAHGLEENEFLKIDGITDKTEDNAGAHQVSITNSTVLTYTTTDSGSTSYTGTITGTGATIYGTTDASGNISSARTYAANQPLRGFARKASGSPYYKVIELNDTVNSSNGLTINRRLVRDD